MIPHITRGGDTRGVIAYLVGRGRREEHVDPHLVAGSAEAVMRAAGRLLERRDVGPLAGFLDEPREGFGTVVTIAERDQDGTEVSRRDAHVWHCSLALHPDEPTLTDARWGERGAWTARRRRPTQAPPRSKPDGIADECLSRIAITRSVDVELA